MESFMLRCKQPTKNDMRTLGSGTRLSCSNHKLKLLYSISQQRQQEIPDNQTVQNTQVTKGKEIQRAPNSLEVIHEALS